MAFDPLSIANTEFSKRYRGESGARQPVHTVYGGAQLFRADSVPKLGSIAARALAEFAPDADALAGAVGLDVDAALRAELYRRVADKLSREPVEDFRIDFEDGYGNRPDTEEDGHAKSVANAVAAGAKAGTLSPFIGIRIKPLNEELRERSKRTLELFMDAMLDANSGVLPPNFVITLPKVTIPEQVTYFVELLRALEHRSSLDEGALRFELMVETPQSIISANGAATLPLLFDAAHGRMAAAHFGTYDYTAGISITASYQAMRHPACDFAKHMMQVALAGTGVWLSDGSTTMLPVAPHRASAGNMLTALQVANNRASVHRAWKLHYDDVRWSLMNGFYQGWDLHPAQLVTRYLAVFAFFLESVDAAGARLKNFVEKAAQATLVGDVFDDAATGQGLLNFFLRGINCGAITEDETLTRTGLTLDELRSRSFVTILRSRGAPTSA
ncbi:MAG: phosphoenolpyruvate kinase [Gemmatimonadota bacterium]|nr:phosphoenolpyruvate kinase [Gemmatimonadota bacterium]